MRKEALLLLAAGRDRPGIVERLSGAIYRAGCNLEDSRMAILGGEFALMVLFTGESEALAAARAELERLAGELDLLFQVKPTELVPRPAGLRYRLHAVSMDHPGIVHRLTRVLSAHGINVARLDTHISHAPVSGTPVFALELEAEIPPDLQLGRLRAELQALADEENIDVELHAVE